MKNLIIYKKEILTGLFCFALFFLLSFFVSHQLISNYKKSYVANNANVLNAIILNHPELEQEIVEAIYHADFNYNTSILDKYGFSDSSVLSYINFIKDLEKETYQIIFFTFFAFFVFCFSLFLIFHFIRERRIEAIHRFLYRVLHNDYQENLDDYREDKISLLKNDLVKVTNKLRNMTEISLNDKKYLEQMMSDISHQLRTPLTSLSLTNEILFKDDLSKEERKKFLGYQEEQLERMNWLIIALLKMSQIDSGTISFQKKPESVLDIVNTALKPLLISMELKNIDIEIKIPSTLKCALDFSWTVEAFGNILKNAMEHTNKGGKILVEAKDTPIYVEIVILDNGVGIPKKDLGHIFERFYKGKEKSDSIGIGLHLSKTIIENLDGVIQVESEVGKGTKFIIHFYEGTV